MKDSVLAYDLFFEKLKNADMPITSWLPLVSSGRYGIPCNDFSGMISNEMFNELFLDGIRNECSFLDHSIYHLDGPSALRHIDSLLSITELDAIPLVPGAGNHGLER